MSLLSTLPFISLLIPKVSASKEKLQESEPVFKYSGRDFDDSVKGATLIVYFRRNTGYNHGVGAVINHPFLRARAKSIPVRVTHGCNENPCNPMTVEKIEIFVGKSLVSEIPPFFVGELRGLSPQIISIQRA